MIFYNLKLVLILILIFVLVLIKNNNFEKFKNKFVNQYIKKKPNIAILIITTKGERFDIEKTKWKKYMNLRNNIKCYFIECNNIERFNNYKLDCKESYKPGIYQKSLLSLKKIGPNYDFYIRTNLSTFLIFDYLEDYLKNIPIDIPILSGRCNNKYYASGTSIVLNKLGRKLLLKYGFKKKYFNNEKRPDDVLIGKVFKDKKNFCSVINKNSLYYWKYNQEYHSNLKTIIKYKYPFIRLKNRNETNSYEEVINKLIKLYYNK